MASGATTIASGGGLADRYAAALYAHAEDEHALDTVVSEMDALARRSIALYANIPWNWMGLAQALALQGRIDEAREAIEPVRAMMPGCTPSRFHWGARYVYGSRFRSHVERDYRVLRDALNACLARPTAPPSG